MKHTSGGNPTQAPTPHGNFSGSKIHPQKAFSRYRGAMELTHVRRSNHCSSRRFQAYSSLTFLSSTWITPTSLPFPNLLVLPHGPPSHRIQQRIRGDGICSPARLHYCGLVGLYLDRSILPLTPVPAQPASSRTGNRNSHKASHLYLASPSNPDPTVRDLTEPCCLPHGNCATLMTFAGRPWVCLGSDRC